MALSLLSLSVSDCSSLLPAARIAEIDHAIASHPVTLLGNACADKMEHLRWHCISELTP